MIGASPGAAKLRYQKVAPLKAMRMPLGKLVVAAMEPSIGVSVNFRPPPIGSPAWLSKARSVLYGSSSRIVWAPVAKASGAPCAFSSTTRKVSSPSISASPITPTGTVTAVWPRGMTSPPEAGT